MLHTLLDALTPWEFSPLTLLCAVAALACYLAGLRRPQAADATPGLWRSLAFFAAVLLLYGVQQTRFDYYAQHLFFAHRLQHLVLHHIGPFLFALSAPQAVLMSGLPRALRERLVQPLLQSGAVRTALRFLLHPLPAALLFVAAILVWLLPSVHFASMLSLPLYRIMNWSMILDGLPFWWLVLDPQAPPRARMGYGARIVMLWLVMLPQIAAGAFIGLSHQDLYQVYAICGRALAISPLLDQQIGGLIIWIPGAMMSALATLLVLRRLLRADEGGAAQAAIAR